MADETVHLAPHGVPSNPMPRALSSTRLHELAAQDQGYGATYASGPNLDIPGQGGVPQATNPFLQEQPTYNNYNAQPQQNFQVSKVHELSKVCENLDHV